MSLILWAVVFAAALILLKLLISLSKTHEKDLLKLCMEEVEKKIERLERESLKAFLSEGDDSVYEKLKGRCVC